jgi:hypothetical protein
MRPPDQFRSIAGNLVLKIRSEFPPSGPFPVFFCQLETDPYFLEYSLDI